MLCQFFSGAVAEPVFLIADRSVRADTIVKLRVPGLSPYSGSSNVGHVWIANPKEGGTRTFFREYFHEIALPAFRANASIQGLLEVVHSKKGKRKRQAQQASTSDAAADMPELKSDDPLLQLLMILMVF
jgi:hypothetical protein